ncbi:MAG: Holliday junction branch migration protein RuvA [Lachnospiraceae bacterium]|nr:Holliday junction branch migration protein RuvA [Lachnospiraceae bacterium]
MIAFVKGILEAVYSDGVIIDHQGIGFDIKTPYLMDRLPRCGSEVKLFTHMYVREDAIGLFGFPTMEELEVFRLLISVNGIGPKAALAVLSTMTVKDLKLAVISDDVKAITKTPGIGPKGAKRLILDLKDKLVIDDVEEDDMPLDDVFEPARADAVAETAQALVSLGYSNSEAYAAIKGVEGKEEMDVETLLKAALKKMVF